MKLFGALRVLFANLIGPKKPAQAFVIGTQMSQALAAQQRHQHKRNGPPSPLAELGYSNAECRLWRWVDSPIDHAVEVIVASFVELREAERKAMRDSLSMDDFYTLLAFAKRRSLAVLRSGDPSNIDAAFYAMAVIELERIDWRDLLVTNWLARYAAQRLSAPLSGLIGRCAQLAEPNVAEALVADASAPVDLPTQCGYREVNTPEGIALFGTGYEHFAPQADLAGIAYEAAVALEGHGYEIQTIELAIDIPMTWLESRHGSEHANMVNQLSGCVSLHGVPRDDPEPRTSGQSLLVFIAEARSESGAFEIAAAAENAANRMRTQVGLSSRRLCAVVIQSSWLMDTPPLEDVQSLQRLRAVLEPVLGQRRTWVAV